MKKITVVVPLYNEEKVVEKFYITLKNNLVMLKNYSHQILFVVDGGRDSTVSILRDIARKDSDTKAVIFSKNFGHQMALLAGINDADGDIVIMMDGDLQHPPALIPRLLEEYEKGNDIVHSIRQDTEDIGFRRKLASIIFYRVMNILSDTPIIEGAADFRLISKRVADIIRHDIHEQNLFLRGLFSWVGFSQAFVHYVAAERAAGKSKYSILKLIRFALSGVTSFSRKPLRAAMVVGFFFALFGFLLAVDTFIEYLIHPGMLPAGWATVVVLVSIMSGVQLIFLGIIGEYIGAIFDEAKARPRYLIEEKINF